MTSPIKFSTKLEQTDLLDLFSGKILALRVFPFVGSNTCKKWQKDLKSKGTLSRYSNAEDVPVNRIGMTLFETENKAEKIVEYLEVGQKTQDAIRDIFGAINPLDQIINTLNSSWTFGCQIQELSNKKMNPGIIRSFEASSNGGLPPHIDSLLKDLPDSHEFDNIQCQLAANLYFDISETGGALELWNYAPSENELENLYTGSYDFIDTTKIPVASKKLLPKQGELILFRSNCVHAVNSSQGGTRSAASCFIGYYDKLSALTVWA